MSEVTHPSGYERSDASARLVAWLAGGLAVFLIAVPFILAGFYSGALRPPVLSRKLIEPPAPRLQVRPKADLLRLRASENERLESYGWADDSRQFAHVPIERAVELLVERGIPGWPRADTDASAPPSSP